MAKKKPVFGDPDLFLDSNWGDFMKHRRDLPASIKELDELYNRIMTSGDSAEKKAAELSILVDSSLVITQAIDALEKEENFRIVNATMTSLKGKIINYKKQATRLKNEAGSTSGLSYRDFTKKFKGYVSKFQNKTATTIKSGLEKVLENIENSVTGAFDTLDGLEVENAFNKYDEFIFSLYEKEGNKGLNAIKKYTPAKDYFFINNYIFETEEGEQSSVMHGLELDYAALAREKAVPKKKVSALTDVLKKHFEESASEIKINPVEGISELFSYSDDKHIYLKKPHSIGKPSKIFKAS